MSDINGAAQNGTYWASKSRQERTLKTIVLIILSIGAVTMMAPLLWMMSTSLKTPTQVFAIPPIWVPDPAQWGNYGTAWRVSDIFLAETWNFLWMEFQGVTFTTYTVNTLIITILGATGVVLSSSLVAFAFARLRFPGRDLLFLLCISTMMVPNQVTMIPTFILFKNLGWYDTFYPLIVPAWFGGGAFNIFLMRQFFMSIPYDMDEAAKIDGCSNLGLFWNILLPLCKPALATIGVFSFVYNWNDFMNPLIYLDTNAKKTLALGLTNFVSLYGQDYHLLMAASLIIMLPIIIIFLFGQKQFIQGIATTGLK
jgi:ABC-type glycerol-3-phosphate transport system permease component